MLGFSEACIHSFSAKKKSNRVEPSSTSEALTVPETKFFEVTPSLKSVFDNTGKTFSLFSSVSTEPADQDDDDDDDDNDAEHAGETLKANTHSVYLSISG